MRQGALPTGDDTLFHLQFAHGMSEGLRDGYLYPRWISEANRGFGSAALINYPPLGGYLVGIAELVSGDLVGAFQLILFVVALGSGVAFYLCARALAPPEVAGLVSALYLLAPYRMIDLHARFAFAEVMAFLWLPLVVKFLLDLDRRPGVAAWTGLVVASAGLLLTHVLTALMIVVTVGPVALWDAVSRRRWNRIGGLVLAAAAASALAAIYLLPLLVERGWTYSEYLTSAWWGDWRANFLFIDPASVGGVPTPIRPLVGFSFWFGLAAAAVAAVLARRTFDRELAGLLTVTLLAIVLQLPVAAFLWQWLPGMELLQFPWRFQTVLVLSSSLLVAKAMPRIDRLSATLIAALGSTAIVFSLFLWSGVSYDLSREVLAEVDLGRLVFKEHIPRGVQGWEEFERLPLEEERRVRTEPPSPVEILEWSSHQRRLRVGVSEPTRVVLRTFYFPGWVARREGEHLPVTPAPPMHAVGVDLAPGSQTVEFRFGSTPDRTLGGLCSLLSLVALVVFYRIGRRGRADRGSKV